MRTFTTIALFMIIVFIEHYGKLKAFWNTDIGFDLVIIVIFIFSFITSIILDIKEITKE